MLQGDELRQAAGQARTVNQDLAGGATVVITTTTLWPSSTTTPEPSTIVHVPKHGQDIAVAPPNHSPKASMTRFVPALHRRFEIRL